MALQQVVPNFVPAGGLGTGDPKPLRRMARPVKVEFRRGGSLVELVDTVMSHRSVQVDAAAGAGKSTVVPSEILKAGSGLLVHMLPSQFLAAELFKHVSKGRNDCYLVDSPSSAWPQAGWVLTSAAVVEARLLTSGKLELPECILYHDEVHRSDCWTYLVSKQWGNIVGVKKYIVASATSGVGDFRKLEPGGKVDVAVFDPSLSDRFWDVHGDGSKPWDVAAVDGNTLIFEDRADFAQHLVVEYARAGFDVYRLHSRMKQHVFQAAMESMASEELTVLVADSTFRDGYTFDLTCTIDCGKVQTTSVVNGVPARVLRDAYEGEVYQGGARGGRTPGSHMVSWRPDARFERKRVALEEVEMDAVALVSRLLSTLVPIEAADSVLAEGRVPNDLVGALRGTQPLACLADTQLVALSSTGYKRAPSPVLREGSDVGTPGLDYRYVGVSADKANQHHFSGLGGSDTTVSVPESSTSGPGSVSARSDWTGELASWAAEAAMAVVEYECGSYYYSPSVRPGVVASAEFPDGWASVLRLYGRDDSLLLTQDMSMRSREVAVAAGLQRFNMLSCEKNAVMAVARDVKAMGRTRSSPLVHTWMNQLLEKATAVSAESATVARLLSSLVAGFCQVEELPASCLDVECRNLGSQLFESLRSIPMAEVTADMATASLKRSVPVPREAPARVPVVAGASDDRYIEMARRGHAARAKPPMSTLGRWIVGYDHNPSVRRIARKLS